MQNVFCKVTWISIEKAQKYRLKLQIFKMPFLYESQCLNRHKSIQNIRDKVFHFTLNTMH